MGHTVLDRGKTDHVGSLNLKKLWFFDDVFQIISALATVNHMGLQWDATPIIIYETKRLPIDRKHTYYVYNGLKKMALKVFEAFYFLLHTEIPLQH